MLSLIQKHSSSFEFFLSPEWKWGKRTQSAASLSMDDYRHTKYIYYCNLPHQVTNVQRMPPPPPPHQPRHHGSSHIICIWECMNALTEKALLQSEPACSASGMVFHRILTLALTHTPNRTHTHTRTHTHSYFHLSPSANSCPTLLSIDKS